MKRLVTILLCGLFFGGATYYAYLEYRISGIPAEHEAVFADLRWLRAEFDLSNEEFEAIAALYEEYRPVCEALCRRVMAAQERVDRLLVESEELTPEIEEALAAFSRVKQECHETMLVHIYQVASHMAPEQRLRYLERVGTHVTMHDRDLR